MLRVSSWTSLSKMLYSLLRFQVIPETRVLWRVGGDVASLQTRGHLQAVTPPGPQEGAGRS